MVTCARLSTYALTRGLETLMKMTFSLLLFTSIKVLNSSPTWKCQKCCVPKAPQNQLSTQFAQVRVRYSLQCIGLSPYRSSSISLVMNANYPSLTWSLMFVFLKAKRHMVLTEERYETCLELALSGANSFVSRHTQTTAFETFRCQRRSSRERRRRSRWWRRRWQSLTWLPSSFPTG